MIDGFFEVVVGDFGVDGFAIEEELESLRAAGAVVGDGDVAPAIFNRDGDF